MSKCDKYNKGGGINPVWLYEKEQERIRNGEENNSITTNITIEYEDDDEDYNDTNNLMCEKVNELERLEQQFEFLKNHSSSPEDLELAKLILGIKN